MSLYSVRAGRGLVLVEGRRVDDEGWKCGLDRTRGKDDYEDLEGTRKGLERSRGDRTRKEENNVNIFRELKYKRYKLGK